jgi:predicted alpha/beta-fold hydrolase
MTYQNRMILNGNPQVHEKIDSAVLKRMKASYQLSHFDSAAHKNNGCSSEHEFCQKISSKNGIQDMPIHFLALNASDDPLYLYSHGTPKDGMHLDKYTENSNVMYVETSHGNHFGYYEGGLFNAFSQHDAA